MGFFIAKRLVVTLLVVFVTSVAAFSLVHLSGDPAISMAGEGASQEQIEAIRRLYQFDRPIHEQYLTWMDKVAHGNFGRSITLREDVGPVIAQHAPVTLTLGLFSLAVALALSIPLGIAGALRPQSALDRAVQAVAVAGQAIPTFLSALALIYLFGVVLKWLPISGSGSWKHYVLPSLALGFYATPAILRLTRAGMIEALRSDHVRTARAFGMPAHTVILRHALRQAIVPVVSLAAVQFGYMLGGSVVVEAIFSLKGLGSLAWQSIQRSDVEVIQAILLLIATTYALLTLAADLMNATLDPRMQLR
ncbi:ABC transporter permease [Labrys neptuniae]